MPSSISSSDFAAVANDAPYVRETASHRPGVAQPVPVRDIPARPWNAISIGAFVMFALMLGAWEWHWRAFGAQPAYRNSDGAWAEQRRRIDHGEGGKTVLIGASRVLFDVQLPVWERITGERPIQLAMEGTSPLPVLEDLAADPAFTGHLLIGIAPDVFFTGFQYRGNIVPYFHKQGPSQRSGYWLSRVLLEPYFAFYDSDFALATVVRRQAWPQRPGMNSNLRVRKLATMDADRNTHIWRKVEVDPDYSALARRIWAQNFEAPRGLTTPESRRKRIDEQIDKAAAAIKTLRARGVQVLFVRPPSNGEYYAFEQKFLGRADTWEPLLQRTGVPGIHFEDYAEMQGYELPEWSHLTAADAERFTVALVSIVQRDFWKPDKQPVSDATAH